MGNRQDEQFKLVVDSIEFDTDKAQSVRIDGELYWIPFSQIHSIHRGEPPHIMITPWIAKQKGFYE